MGQRYPYQEKHKDRLLCEDCRHHFYNDGYYCLKFKSFTDYVTGVDNYYDCDACRQRESSCGPKAKHFEPQPEKPPKKPMDVMDQLALYALAFVAVMALAFGGVSIYKRTHPQQPAQAEKQ